MQTERIWVTVFRANLFWVVNGLCLIAAAYPVFAQQSVYLYDAFGNTVGITNAISGVPVINMQPQTQLLESNAPISFSVVATSPGVSYQWLSNGVPITGATSDTLYFPGLTTTNDSFSVILSNYSGSVTSSPAAIWADANGNGIPDWWEMQYFGNLNQTANGDYDGDGVDNREEYLEGTNPTNSLSYNPRLYIESGLGTVAVSPDLPYYTMGQIVVLTALPDAGHTFLGWSGPATGSKSTISLVMNQHITETANFGLPLALALTDTNLFCTTGGDAPWFGQTQFSEDGLGAAQSGALIGGQQSWLKAVTAYLTQNSQLAFWWNVSSQPPDGLSFSIDGIPLSSISGSAAGWQLFQANLTKGNHVLIWTYTKVSNDNAAGIPYADAGWVDEVSITPSP